MTVEFFMACEPPTVNFQSGRVLLTRPIWSQKKGRMVNVPRLADSRELADAKRMLDSLMLPHRLKQPISGPVSLTIEFTWPWRTSDTKRARAAGRQPKVTRPDCGNTAKTLEDRLVAMGFLEDDAQVVRLIVCKWVGATPGIRVAIVPFVDSLLPWEGSYAAPV